MNNQLKCPKCSEEYSLDNLPKKLINCSHVICNKCLNEEIICPSCRKRIQKRKYLIESFLTHEETFQKMKNSSNLSENIIAQEYVVQIHTPVQEIKLQKPSISKVKKDEQKQRSLYLNPNKENNKNEFAFDKCLLHSKVADLICLNDKCLICSNCGLFGQHKGHKLLPYDQFLLQFTKITEQSFKIYESLKERDELFIQQTLEEQINILLQQKRDKQLKSIKSQIIALNSMVKRYQTQLIANLDTIITFKREKILQGLKLQQTLSKKQNFMYEIQKMSKGIQQILKVQNFEEYLKYLDKNSPQGYIINEGEYLVVQIDNIYKNLQHTITTQTQQFGYQFNIQQDVIRSMIKLASKDIKEVQHIIDQKNKQKIIPKSNRRIIPPTYQQKPEEKSPIVKVNDEDPLLLETNSKSGSKQSNTKGNNKDSPTQSMIYCHQINITPIRPFDQSNNNNSNINSSLNNFFGLKNSSNLSNHKKNPSSISTYTLNNNRDNNKNKNKETNQNRKNRLSGSRSHLQAKSKPKNPLYSNQNSQRNNILGERSQNKKRRRLDLTDKYLKIYEQLQKDRLDIIDLGGGFLGDSNILYISQLFPSRNKLKSAKLMNNKITDQVFPQLIDNCRHLGSLNLSYNALTEKSLDYLQRQCAHLGQLKNITLSNNKIVLRNVRDRLQELERQGLKISL